MAINRWHGRGGAHALVPILRLRTAPACGPPRRCRCVPLCRLCRPRRRCPDCLPPASPPPRRSWRCMRRKNRDGGALRKARRYIRSVAFLSADTHDGSYVSQERCVTKDAIILHSARVPGHMPSGVLVDNATWVATGGSAQEFRRKLGEKAVALRALSLTFVITARVTVACHRYRHPSYCRCLQCQCTRSKSSPTSRPSSLLCRTGLWRVNFYRYNKSDATRNTVLCVHDDCSFRARAIYSASRECVVVYSLDEVHTCLGAAPVHRGQSSQQSWLQRILPNTLPVTKTTTPQKIIDAVTLHHKAKINHEAAKKAERAALGDYLSQQAA